MIETIITIRTHDQQYFERLPAVRAVGQIYIRGLGHRKRFMMLLAQPHVNMILEPEASLYHSDIAAVDRDWPAIDSIPAGNLRQGLISILIATLKGNNGANVVSLPKHLSNLGPSLSSFRTGGPTTGLLGLTLPPWRLMVSHTNLAFAFVRVLRLFYDYVWFVGFFVAGATYLVLMNHNASHACEHTCLSAVER
jgi:cytosine/uracil/thiamine/allantoin permease